MANEIYDSTWWGNTRQTASSIGTSTEMIQGQFNLTKIGDEEVTNGDFTTDSDWTLVGTATISNGKAHINSPSGEVAEIYQTNILEIGKSYILNCDLEKISGDTQFVNGGTFILNNGYNVIEFTANDVRVYFKRGAGSVISSIDNVSVKEVRATTVEASKCLADAIHRIGIQDIQN